MNCEKEKAALLYALARCRGALISVQQGNHNPSKIRKVLEHSSLEFLKQVLGPEASFPDWDTHLSQEEKNQIAGFS